MCCVVSDFNLSSLSPTDLNCACNIGNCPSISKVILPFSSFTSLIPVIKLSVLSPKFSNCSISSVPTTFFKLSCTAFNPASPPFAFVAIADSSLLNVDMSLAITLNSFFFLLLSANATTFLVISSNAVGKLSIVAIVF